jgi:hypothetical protein
MQRAREGVAVLAAVALCALAATLLSAAVPVARAKVPAPAAAMKIDVLSNRADLISEGDALVQIVVPSGVDPRIVRVDVGGRDVTSAFAVRSDGRFIGRLENLALGSNVLTAKLSNKHGSRITITNYPKGGPIFSGQQIQPWLCTTSSNGLGPAQDVQCNAPTRYDFFYMPSGGGGFQAYDPNNPPADVGTTTTDQGKTVPYIIRQETGTQDRGIYRIAVLYDPTKPFEPWASQDGWNHKLFYPFGASCGTVHSQSSAQNVQNAYALGRGFMVATSSMNVLGNNCNTVTSAESVMMLKERIVERYGEIRFTFGQGGSGGSIGQHMVANSYPGLLQGLTVTQSFPDNTGTTGMEVQDCHLLVHYYTQVSPELWANPAQQAAVNGHKDNVSCVAWEALFSAVDDPHNGCGVDAAHGGDYNEDTNRTGCRGANADFQFPIWGPRPPSVWNQAEQALGRGFGRFHYDNVGVQYGLKALQDGKITTEQFVDLNEKIGGLDIDYHFTFGMRRQADPDATRIAYRTGAVNDGSQLDRVAIIDSRGQGDVDPLGIHTMHHTFALRERLRNANGTDANHVVWRGGTPPGGTFVVMDKWLSAVEADTSSDSLEAKIIRDKPPEAANACWVGDTMFTDEAQCDLFWPYFGAPRTVAGGPRAHDVIKCQLKPLNRSDNYGALPFTDLQWQRLKGAFPNGVCDYSKPAADRVQSVPWLTYQDGLGGGQPLGPAPASSSF